MERSFRSIRKLGGSVTVAACLAAPALAQEEPMLEEVVVSGIRGSLLSAASIKENAGGVVDAISAEDMGKFPDSNVAESLQRVTGVAITAAAGALDSSSPFVAWARNLTRSPSTIVCWPRRIPAANLALM